VVALLPAVPSLALAESPSPETVVVGADSPSAARAIARELREEGIEAAAIPHIGALTVSGEGLAVVEGLVDRDPRVAWIEPSRTRSLFMASAPDVDPFTSRPFDWAADGVAAPEDLVTAGGPPVAVVDSGADVAHPDLAGRIGPTYDTLTNGTVVKDLVGHGTFVAGLISAIDGNGIGSRGVAGATSVLPIRVTTTGVQIKSADIAEGIVRAVDAGAGVINLSLGGPALSEVERTALDYAAAQDVLVVAAAGNTFQVVTPVPNPPQYPAAAIGGFRGSWSTGLSVAATDPLGRHARFSTANDFVSVAAPGSGLGGCGDGVFSAIPANPTTLWDNGSTTSCTRVVDSFGAAGGRYGYAEGTSFAAPLVAGAAALVRGANPDLSAEQTADVIRRSAHQTIGTGWNRETGAGVLDVGTALHLATVYDTLDPEPALVVTPGAGTLTVSLAGRDAASPQAIAAGIASYGLESSSDGVTYSGTIAPRPAPIRLEEAPPAGQPRWYRGTLCDVNHNCAHVVSGPVTANRPVPPLAPRVAALPPPRFASVVAGRPGGCATCVRVAFTTQGAGSVTWAISLTSARAGVKPIRRAGVVPAGGRVVAVIPLSRIPSCRGRLALALSLSSPSGVSRASRTLAVSEACAPR
jgi:subtilisin family serine protease